ncbi:MAG: deaminase [Bacteroidota bacterium]|jgi:cytosine deaminase
MTDKYLLEAVSDAKKGLYDSAILIGALMVIKGKIVGCSYNRSVQKESAILHAEMGCFENAGRLTSKDYKRAVLYSTLFHCIMAELRRSFIEFLKLFSARKKTLCVTWIIHLLA